LQSQLLLKIAEESLKIDAAKVPLPPLLNPVKSKLITDLLRIEPIGKSNAYISVQ